MTMMNKDRGEKEDERKRKITMMMKKEVQCRKRGQTCIIVIRCCSARPKLAHEGTTGGGRGPCSLSPLLL